MYDLLYIDTGQFDIYILCKRSRVGGIVHHFYLTGCTGHDRLCGFFGGCATAGRAGIFNNYRLIRDILDFKNKSYGLALFDFTEIMRFSIYLDHIIGLGLAITPSVNIKAAESKRIFFMVDYLKGLFF